MKKPKYCCYFVVVYIVVVGFLHVKGKLITRRYLVYFVFFWGVFGVALLSFFYEFCLSHIFENMCLFVILLFYGERWLHDDDDDFWSIRMFRLINHLLEWLWLCDVITHTHDYKYTYKYITTYYIRKRKRSQSIVVLALCFLMRLSLLLLLFLHL